MATVLVLLVISQSSGSALPSSTSIVEDDVALIPTVNLIVDDEDAPTVAM